MKIGVIGGSGLYDMDGFEHVCEEAVTTPYGNPSDALVCGTLNGVEAVFLARHGRGHTIMPSEVNFRANIYAMKMLGVSRIISVSAVGSFREDLAPRDIVMVDQFVDRTKRNLDHTFFGQGIVAHIAFADPICEQLRTVVGGKAAEVLATASAGPSGKVPQVHMSGTYLNMEGPAFSTRAESFLYKSWGMDVIGMTNLAEAKLAREAEICYCSMAMVTDYDCWHESHESVSVDLIVQTLMANAANAKSIIRKALPAVASGGNCSCQNALQNAIITAPDRFPPATRRRLAAIIDKYYPENR
jgi:5'-methylthioadenosine phosphorylase